MEAREGHSIREWLRANLDAWGAPRYEWRRIVSSGGVYMAKVRARDGIRLVLHIIPPAQPPTTTISLGKNWLILSV